MLFSPLLFTDFIHFRGNMEKMGLKLRRDVQKASYYVWFLGAQEARGLRGSRIILPVIPKLIERSREQEPLKVTLQVSHKGLKIIQVFYFLFDFVLNK